MILGDEGKTIRRYDKNKVLPNVDGVAVSMKEYKRNKIEVHDHDIHHSLCVDFVKHIYSANIQPDVEY